MTAALWLVRIVVVLALVCVAALLATPPGRLPLALRGLAKLVRRDRDLPTPPAAAAASPLRRFLAFLLVLLAFAVAVL